MFFVFSIYCDYEGSNFILLDKANAEASKHPFLAFAEEKRDKFSLKIKKN